jgi:phage terminase large subunit-like protein
VIGVDLGVKGDLSELVVVSDHPFMKKKQPAIRAVEVFIPPPGEEIDYSTTIDLSLRRWNATHNVVGIAYDPFQAKKMMDDLARDPGIYVMPISQGKGSDQNPGRTVLDKMFYDAVMSGQLSHNGDPTLRQHVMNAVGKNNDERYLHFFKKSPELKIDALVAASMGVGLHSQLNLR